MGFLDKIFAGKAKDVVDSVGNAIDKIFTSKEEKAEAMLAIEKEINRHMEQLELNILKEKELENQDRSSARIRESEFVKATGHVDYMMWFLAISIQSVFIYVVWSLIHGEVPKENREILIGVFGVLETVIVGMYAYYWGSSAGSRIKDMRGKQY